MATTYTTIWRLAILATGDPATVNSWGVLQAATMSLMEQGAVSQIAVSINALTSYTLTTANNATDQARYLSQNYTGALTGTCTVTMPNVNKVGWAQNNTTGGHNVVLTAGAGTTATIPPDGRWYWYWCDGATNVSLPSIGLASLSLSSNLTITSGGITITGNSSIAGALTVSTAGTSGNQVVNNSQFVVTTNSHGWAQPMPGGWTRQWGNLTTDGTGHSQVQFPVAFSGTPQNIQLSLKDAAGVVTSAITLASGALPQANLFDVYASSDGVGIAVNFFWEAIGPT